MRWLEVICLQSSMEAHTYTPGPTRPYSNNPAAARTARNMSDSQITRIIAVVAAGQVFITRRRSYSSELTMPLVR